MQAGKTVVEHKPLPEWKLEDVNTVRGVVMGVQHVDMNPEDDYGYLKVVLLISYVPFNGDTELFAMELGILRQPALQGRRLKFLEGENVNYT